MKIKIKCEKQIRSLLLFSLVVAVCTETTVVLAQTRSSFDKGSGEAYPVRPIRVIVPGSAGSANDFTARAIAQRFTEAVAARRYWP